MNLFAGLISYSQGLKRSLRDQDLSVIRHLACIRDVIHSNLGGRADNSHKYFRVFFFTPSRRSSRWRLKTGLKTSSKSPGCVTDDRSYIQLIQNMGLKQLR
jgi:hypothetical protein